MGVYTIKGNAVNLFIKAESMEAAEKILSAPLAEVFEHLTGVWFEHCKGAK